MSILIKGMEMPEEDGVYTLRIWGNGRVERLESYHAWLLTGVRAEDIPKHGRLIDADAAIRQGWTISRNYSASPTENVYEVKTMDALPTIIEAEEGE